MGMIMARTEIYAPRPDRYPVSPVAQSRRDATRYVNLNELPPAKKQQLWAAIKRKRQALADLLGDGFVTCLREAFDATPQLTLDDYNTLMENDDDDRVDRKTAA